MFLINRSFSKIQTVQFPYEIIMNILKRYVCSPYVERRLLSSASTIDSQEIERFQKLTSEWWDEFGPTKGLHSMNRLRVPFIRDGLINEGAVSDQNIHTATPLKGLSILDVGCGGGILSEALSRLGAKVTGLDANPSIIDLARKHAEQSNLHINYLFSSIEEHSKDNCETYDAIAASEILEHVAEKESFAAACVNCLKQSGSIFVTTINKTFLANLLGIFVVENIVELVPKGTHQFEKFIEPHKLQRILADKMADMHYVYGLADGNAEEARRIYHERYPNRDLPDSRVVCTIS